MKRSTFSAMDCSIARALDVVGEWWTLLILRDAFHGLRRFDEFEKSLGIASNILADRLGTLTEAGILARRTPPEDRRRAEYKLTEKGLALHAVLVALMEWGDRWESNGGGPRLTLVERATGEPVPPLALRSRDGRALRPQDVIPEPGPGVGPKARAFLRKRAEHLRAQGSLQKKPA